MARFYPARTASFVITLFGAITNFVLAIQVLSVWRSFKWEPESEWEAPGDGWRVDGLKIIWGILCAYFTAAAAVSAVGFAGLLKNKATMVRFYRDYSIADFSFCGFLAVVGTYSAFRSSAGAGVCEEFSRHPELMRDMLEMGLNIENCERWFGQALSACIAIMVVVMVIRLHFLLAVANYYKHLTRHQLRAVGGLPLHNSHTSGHSRTKTLESFQRVLLLPRPISHSSQDGPSAILVYAPVPMKSLSPEAAQELSANATEAWVTRSDPEMQRHHRRHRRSLSSSSIKSDSTGQICLPIQPGEALLPAYGAATPAAKA